MMLEHYGVWKAQYKNKIIIIIIIIINILLHSVDYSHDSNIIFHVVFLQGDELETVTSAVVNLFKAQPNLASQLPQLGHIPTIIGAMKSKNTAIPRATIITVNSIVDDDVSISLYY